MRKVHFGLLACVGSLGVGSTPNILFLLADDQGFGDIGYTSTQGAQPGAGGKRWTPNPPHTPNLDALARAPGTIVFDRMYSGSPVCSPTRASLLSGRTPDRECVFNAEGCGQQPAWACINPEPFPGGYAAGASNIYTAANAAKDAGYLTLHTGKFHLGDFFPKANKNPSYAYKKWPVMHPGMVGFDFFFSTEASASSTMCNCGCDPAWPNEPPGCVIGGGVYVMGKSFDCTNYWYGTMDSDPACLSPTHATLACVTNSTTKIPGDDSLWQLARFEAFLNSSRAAGKPFFATVQLHTNHQPHPALPEYFWAYNGTDGLPAGDYLGTLTQMDAAVGALVALLKRADAFEDTLLWYAADNGPHIGPPGGIPVKNTATNGLRQCKASVFEGGIHVPGFVSWPRTIAANRRASVPVYVPDFLPTVLDVLGRAHPKPGYAADGESILPLLKGAPFSRSRFLAWRLGKQVALLDPAGRFKYVRAGDVGQCAKDYSNFSYAGENVFDLEADPTESTPIANKTKVAELGALAAAWEASIASSQVNESQCLPGSASAVRFQRNGGGCLAAVAAKEHAAVGAAGDCAAGALNQWAVDLASGAVTLAEVAGGWCFHVDNKQGGCAAGTGIWMGQVCDGAMTFDAPTGTFQTLDCPGMCAGAGADGAVALAKCSDAAAAGWVVLGGGWRGGYVQPFD